MIGPTTRAKNKRSKTDHLDAWNCIMAQPSSHGMKKCHTITTEPFPLSLWRFQPVPFGPENQSKTLDQIKQRKCSSPPHLCSCLATMGWVLNFFQPEAGTVKDSVLAWVSSFTKTVLIYDVCTPANWCEGKTSCLETLPVGLRSRHRTKADHSCQAATRAAWSKSAATDLTNSKLTDQNWPLDPSKIGARVRSKIYLGAPCLYCTCFP